MYDVNYTELLEQGVREANKSWPMVGCRQGWIFNHTMIPYASIAAEVTETLRLESLFRVTREFDRSTAKRVTTARFLFAPARVGLRQDLPRLRGAVGLLRRQHHRRSDIRLHRRSLRQNPGAGVLQRGGLLRLRRYGFLQQLLVVLPRQADRRFIVRQLLQRPLHHR